MGSRSLFSALGLAVFLQAGSALTLGVPQDVLDDYRTLVAGRPVLGITDYRGPGSRRDTVEVILFQQALHLGGIDDPIDFEPIDSYKRILLEVTAGRVAASPTSVWAQDAEGTAALLSAPLIEDGEYMVGIYAVAGNNKVLHADLAALRTMTAVTNPAWNTDVQVLKELGITKIEGATTFVQIASMVIGGRGDFFLRSFKPTPDLSAEYNGTRFVPVPGVKVAFPGSRHFLVAPGEKDLLAALDKGIRSLKSRGRIHQAYIDAGFFSPLVESWTVLNPR